MPGRVQGDLPVCDSHPKGKSCYWPWKPDADAASLCGLSSITSRDSGPTSFRASGQRDFRLLFLSLLHAVGASSGLRHWVVLNWAKPAVFHKALLPITPGFLCFGLS